MHIVNSILKLSPGVYVLRHPKNGQAPLSVTRAPASQNNNGTLEVIGTPRTKGTHLYDGSDCIVLHVAGDTVEMMVTAFLPNEGAVIPALRLDQIGLDGAAKTEQSAGKAGQFEIVDKGLSVIGHIERRGDRMAGPGELLGEPAEGLRIEGFQVMWPDRPAGVDLAYNIAVEGFGSLPLVKSGAFCGTRGQARRITEVTFALVGPDANRYTLEGTAYFSGGFQVPVVSGQPLGGPSGLEHLSGLTLIAKPAKVTAPGTPPGSASTPTKVFKAKAAAAVTAPIKKVTAKAGVGKQVAKTVAVKPPAKSAAKNAPAKTAAKSTAKASRTK